MPHPFDADAYWSSRLNEHWGLTGVGHQEYPEHYNRWLYRRKRAVLRRALGGRVIGEALDLGSGTGWVVQQLKAAGATRVAGCELTAVGVDRLRGEHPDVSFHRVEIGVDPLPAGTASIDTVTMLDVIYHLVDDAKFEQALAEIARVLRPGGAAIITDTLAASSQQPGEHVVFRGRDRWDPALSAVGLRIASTHPYFKALSHPREATWRHWWHPRLRGPVEWAMDTVLPLRPWLRLAVIERVT
ncbi:MAG: class I SAM-dependent methyltransferase [Frankiaceae bacterium]|nr:class I SAM-dependent methyltransferase [Frankiaceae bacterium]MBV9871458.1 class I SAM-dependent methyltransferase [Frankiaceae bacterium]